MHCVPELRPGDVITGINWVSQQYEEGRLGLHSSSWPSLEREQSQLSLSASSENKLIFMSTKCKALSSVLCVHHVTSPSVANAHVTSIENSEVLRG